MIDHARLIKECQDAGLPIGGSTFAPAGSVNDGVFTYHVRAEGTIRLDWEVAPTAGQITTANTVVQNYDASVGADLAYERSLAVGLVVNTERLYKVLRGVLLAAVEEVNLMRQRDAAWKTAVANATSLANLKVLIAALPDLPDRTAAQAKTAVVNKINSGDAD